MIKTICRLLTTKKSRVFIKKYCILITFLLMALMVSISGSINTVNASTPSKDNQAVRQKIDNILDGIGITNVKYMKEAYDNFASFAQPSRQTGHASSNLPFTARIGGFIRGFAYFFCFVFATIGIIKESQRGEISMDYWTRIFAATAMAIIIVANVDLVMNAIYDTGGVIIDGVVSAVTDAESSTSFTEMDISIGSMSEESKAILIRQLSMLPGLNGYEQSLVDNLEEAAGEGEGTTEEAEGGLEENEEEKIRIGTLEDVYYGNTDEYLAIQYINDLMEPLQLICLLPLLASMYLTYSMLFEIKLRQIFAPIAVATIGYDGARASGIRFLKKYLTCFLRIGMYFVIAAIGTEMTRFFYARAIMTDMESVKTMTVGIATNLILMFGSNVLAAMTMFQAGSLADEIVGT